MNAILRGALLALVCSLCIYTVTATSPSCVQKGATVGNPYNNCTELCCQNGIVKSTADLSSCCHDAATSYCGVFGMKCCTPTPAVTVVADQAARACYVDGPQGCCSWQTQPSFDLTTSVGTFKYNAQPFFTDTQQCCTAPNGGYWVPGTGANHLDYPIVPKYVSSCTKYMAEISPTPQYLMCFADADCPTGNKCCRTPQQTADNTVGKYNMNSPGKCYDPNYYGCCGGGAGVKKGDTGVLYNQTYFTASIYDPKKQTCCTFPVQKGGESLLTDLGGSCPCLLNTDCPSANYTCCAPSEVELINAGVRSRYLKCDAGCPTENVGAPTAGSSYFPGCYGQCILSTTSNQFNNKVCLTSTGLGDRCPNLRVWLATTYSPAQVSDLVKTESDAHWQDCCLAGSDAHPFSVLYDTRKEYCCPVLGNGLDTAGANRHLGPTVHITSAANANTAAAKWEACLCSGDADCPNGQSCCMNANTYVSSGQSNLNYMNYTGLCYDSRVTQCCSFNTNSQPGGAASGAAWPAASIYDPSTQQCCMTGVSATDTACQCHADSDCISTHQACCKAEVQLGNTTHEAGICYDTRVKSCCQSNPIKVTTDPADPTNGLLVYRANGMFTMASIYDNTTQVCCALNGLKANLQQCECRWDHTDCGAKMACCASNGTTLAAGDIPAFAGSHGHCYNPDMQACCVYKWQKSTDFPDIYDKQREVCCPNNGKADDHRGCKCGANNECPASGECCMDAQASDNDDVSKHGNCNKDNCVGRCIHTDLETCCDDPFVSEFAASHAVSACANDYQTCCNGQCCNKAIETCMKVNVNKQDWVNKPNMPRVGYSAFAAADDSGIGYHYGMDIETKTCTTTEHSAPSLVFHAWVFPAFLSIAGLVMIAMGAKTALGSDISPNMIKLALVGLSTFVGIMSLLLLWSPLWKYGFVILVANKVIFVSFHVGGLWSRRFGVVVAVVCFLWIVEPFGSNSILNFGTVTYAGNQQTDGAGGNGQWYNAHGLNYAARLLQRNRNDWDSEKGDACTAFYQYWLVDSKVHDARDWNPAGITRGICRRSWMHTITVMAGLITPFQTIFLLLAGLALAKSDSSPKESKVQPA